MKRLSQIIEHIALIFSKQHFTIRQRLSLFFAYVRIVIKRFLRGRISLGINYKHEYFLGYQVQLDQFRDDFYWIFTEIFIEENYFFKTQNKTPCIVDVGGNIGMSVLYFKTIYPMAKILTFEPSPDNLEILRKNIDRNNIKDVTIFPFAVGNREREIIIYTQGPGTTIHPDFAQKQKRIQGGDFGKEVSVQIKPISDFVIDCVDFMKFDVEGAEVEILENLDEAAKLKKVDQIAMEYHQFSATTNKFSQVSNLLEKNGFVFFCASDAHNITEATKGKYKTFMVYAKRNEK